MSSAMPPSSQPASCVSCGSERIARVGALAPSIRFAGRVLDAPLPGGALYACAACHLSFRYPVLPKATLNELYRRGAPGSWQYRPEKRRDWQVARGWLRAHRDAGAILDVGCYDGAFLDQLSAGWQRFGIEINERAVREAEARGVQIVGRDVAEVARLGRRFDAIVAFDLIEHVVDPRRLLAQMAERTAPGGLVILSTGNTEARTWQWMGSRYWYCTIPEHLAFIGERWCAAAADALGLRLRGLERFSHDENRTPLRVAAEVVKNGAFRVWPAGFGRLRALGLGETDVAKHPELRSSPPIWMTAKDHLIVLFEKP